MRRDKNRENINLVKLHYIYKVSACLFVLLGSQMVSSCASVSAPDKRDPWESFNRSVYEFNDDFDRGIGQPVAEAYKDNVPGAVQTGVSNFFNNLDDILVVVNDVLQFKFEQAAQDLGRFTFNTTFGVLGLFDVATYMGYPKHNEDFGQTFATWGIGSGPYLVLPFLGPSNARDTTGLFFDAYVDPLIAVRDDETRWGLVILRAVDKRASLLEATRLMEKSGIDPYVFMRDAYYQHRENQIYDGNPPSRKIEAPTKEDLDLERELELELNSPSKS
jgi:phospholipid-binding lipoprotein MlaA